MSVGVNVHNLIVVGILSALFSLMMALANRTALANVPVLGAGIRLLAPGGSA